MLSLRHNVNDHLLFKQSGPQYTIRFLLDEVISPEGEVLKLKSFSHFTLGCTAEDKTLEVKAALDNLSEKLKTKVVFKALDVCNLGDDQKPLWSIKLDLGPSEQDFRELVGRFFDPLMCAERNGHLYLWNTAEGEVKCPHITIGASEEDLALAKKIVATNCIFSFNQMDYKKVGPHDPHVSVFIKGFHLDEQLYEESLKLKVC